MLDSLVSRFPTSNRMLLVALGDLVTIGVFVGSGEISHGRPVQAGGATFLSFAIGWIVAATLVDAYSRRALSTLTHAAGYAAGTWTLAALIGAVVRFATVDGATLAPTFVVVSIAFGAVLLIIWRVFASLVFG